MLWLTLTIDAWMFNVKFVRAGAQQHGGVIWSVSVSSCSPVYTGHIIHLSPVIMHYCLLCSHYTPVNNLIVTMHLLWCLMAIRLLISKNYNSIFAIKKESEMNLTRNQPNPPAHHCTDHDQNLKAKCLSQTDQTIPTLTVHSVCC